MSKRSKFKAFRDAYNDLINVEGVDDIINDNVETYPFNISFDELDINTWVDSIINYLDS